MERSAAPRGDGTRSRNALEIKLVSSRAESESLTDRLAVSKTDPPDHANAEAQLDWHKMELARQEAAWHESIDTQERLQTSFTA